MADPTLCGLVGVPPADTVTMNGAERPIDGIDVWPLLLSRASESPREYLPTTEHSLIWKGRWKLITLAGGFNKPWDPTQIQGQVGYGGWYPPALGSNDSTTEMRPECRAAASSHSWRSSARRSPAPNTR